MLLQKTDRCTTMKYDNVSRFKPPLAVSKIILRTEVKERSDDME